MTVAAHRPSAPSRFALRFIDTYRERVSPRLEADCRFEPSCSAYGRAMFERHGFLRASVKTVARISRCRGRRNSAPS